MSDELIAIDAELGEITEKIKDSIRTHGKCTQAVIVFNGYALERASLLKQGEYVKWLRANEFGYGVSEAYNFRKFLDVIKRIITDNGKTPPSPDEILNGRGPCVKHAAELFAKIGVELPQFLTHGIEIAKLPPDEWTNAWNRIRDAKGKLTHERVRTICSGNIGGDASGQIGDEFPSIGNSSSHKDGKLPVQGSDKTITSSSNRSSTESRNLKELPERLRPKPNVVDVLASNKSREEAAHNQTSTGPVANEKMAQSLPSPETAKSPQTGNAELERALKRIAELEAEVASLREENGKLREENGKPAEELHLGNGEDIEARAKQWVAVYDSCDAKTKTKLFRAIREKRLKSDAGELDAEFEAFWQAYPASGRANRRKTYQEWEEAMVRLRKTSKEEPEGGWVAFIIGRAAFMASSPIAKRDNGKYVKNAENWLKADGWWDDDAKYNREEYNKMTVGAFRPEHVGKGGVL